MLLLTNTNHNIYNMFVANILINTSFLVSLICFSTMSIAENSSFDELWQQANLYENSQGDYFKLSGRLHIDSAWFDSDQEQYSDITWRRFRFGFKSHFNRFTGALEADIDLNNNIDNWYNRLTDANFSYKPNNDLTLTFLKHSTGFTLDGRTSSKKLLTPQRNNLTNNLWFTAEYFSGLSAKGNFSDTLTYNAGIFSSDDSDEIGFTNASYFSLISLSNLLTRNSSWDSAQFNFDYVFNDAHIEGNTAKISSLYSFSGLIQKNNWALSHDISYAQGALDQSNMWGFVVMPYYQQTELLQWVVRYTYLTSDENNGLKLGRYENKIESERGDKYQELYTGVNLLFYQHKLKLQMGLQYADMQDKADDGGEYQGWGVTLAIRSYW